MFIENESSFVLGRGHESDVRISDISVSRIHAKIYMKNNQFYLEDLGSKFGSLVLAKEAVCVSNLVKENSEKTKSIIQIGRTLVYFEDYEQYKKNEIHKSSQKLSFFDNFKLNSQSLLEENIPIHQMHVEDLDMNFMDSDEDEMDNNQNNENN